MHEKDRALIQSGPSEGFFGNIGYVSKVNNTSTVEFRVSTLKDLVDMAAPPEKIVNIKASLNTGLSKDLKNSFPKYKPITLKTLESYDTCVTQPKSNNLHPEWLAGFCTGESNFFIACAASQRKKSKTKSGLSVSLRFSIAQHSRDLLLLESFINFFGGGFVMNYKQRPVCEYTITKIDLIIENIIPFFDKHPILGSKHLNF
ncbi:hypothetical protein HYFRA_00013633 [Hymenoscyphus fraxineus]|uniref:Homing endonuclease LAGLIDADG domain-containing protein n=1 Tax=Hymenoscyphus fraxineus TaxID=746836 RepID=A0A9N9LDP0_9HELO|nr:hypothetical protein HYFRA_00013633 [Hymenoscyphus fraxineus]